MRTKPIGSGRPTNTPERVQALFAAKTRPTGDGCLVWTGRRNEWGYVQLKMAGSMRLAHRVAYELARGSLSDELVIDHLCHTRDKQCPGGLACEHRACLNPDHMEPVTHAENTRRAGHRKANCRHGHAFTPKNTYIDPKGHRYCRTCGAATKRRSYERKLLRAAGITERAA